MYLLLSVLVIIVYGLTAPPSLTWSHWGSDGGNLITAAVTGRIPHPPGFPAYLYVARVMVTAFRQDPARLLTVLSALLATGTVVLVAATLRRRSLHWLVVTAASLSLAFGYAFWSQAIIVEVYAAAAFIGALVFYLTKNLVSPGFIASVAVGLVLGLAVSVHLTLAALTVYLLVDGRVRRGPALLGLWVGLVPYALTPLWGPWPQPWGDLRSLGGWAEYVSARLYWGNAFALPMRYWLQRLIAWLALMSRQFSPFGILFVVPGVAVLVREHRRTAIGIGLTLIVASVYAMTYNTPDSWTYLIGYLPLLAYCLALGLDWALDQGMPAWLCLILPLMLLTMNWSRVDLSGDTEATVWLEATLSALPSDAVILTHEDRYTFALWYATDAVGRRPDLLVVDERLWGYLPYRAYIEQQTGQPIARLRDLASARPFCELDSWGAVVCW